MLAGKRAQIRQFRVAPSSGSTKLYFVIQETAHALTVLHADTLGIDSATITVARAERTMPAEVPTTTELLLLIAKFHESIDDLDGAALLADFATAFAAHESKVV